MLMRGQLSQVLFLKQPTNLQKPIPTPPTPKKENQKQWFQELENIYIYCKT